MSDNPFRKSPVRQLIDEWDSQPRRARSVPEISEPRTAASPSPSTLAQPAIPDFGALQQQLDAQEPGRYRVLTQEQAQQLQREIEQQASQIGEQAIEALDLNIGSQPLSADDAGQYVSSLPEPDQEALAEGFWSRLPQAAKGGWENMARSLGVTHAVLSDDFTPETIGLLSETIREQIEQAQREESRQHPSERRIKQAIEDFGKTEGFVDTTTGLASLLGTVFVNPKGLAIGTVEQLANMLPSVAGGVAGAGAGGGTGAVVGSVVPGVGTAAGAAFGALWGSRAGFAAGTAAIEYGFEMTEAITSRLKEQGKPPTDENIAELLSSPEVQNEIKSQAARKGLTLAAVDSLFMGLAGKIGAKGLSQSTRRGKAKYAAGAFGTELAGEPAAEGLSQLAARGEVDKSDVAAEGIYGAGTAIGGTAVGTASQALYDRARGGQEGRLARELDRQVARAEFAGTPEQVAAAQFGAESQAGAGLMPEPQGPLGRAMKGAIESNPEIVQEAASLASEAPGTRVLAKTPEGDIPGVVDSISPDGTVRVMSEEGMMYEFGPQDVVLEPIAEAETQDDAQVRDERVRGAEDVAQDEADPSTRREADQGDVDLGRRDVAEPSERQPGEAIPDAAPTTDTQPALSEPDEAQEAQPADTAARQEPVKWFGSREKADAWVSKQKTGNYEIVQDGRRFNIYDAAQDGTTQDSTAAANLELKRDGSPFQSRQQAERAIKNRRLQGYQPVEIEGGFALAPATETSQEPATDAAISDSEGYRERSEERASRIEAAETHEQIDEILEEHSADPAGHLEGYDRIAALAKTKKRLISRPVEEGIVHQGGSEREAEGVASRLSRENPDKSYQVEPRSGDFGSYYVVKEGVAEPDSEPKPKRKAAVRQTRSEKGERSRQRARDTLGADVGDVVTPSTDVGYSRSGESYRIDEIGADGTVYVTNAGTGSKTSWSRSDLTVAQRRGAKFAPVRQEGETEQQEASATTPQASANTIFTEDAAEKARQILRSKLSQLNTGIDPEIMQAGITLAGYHIEKGARTFAAYAQAMVGDMGNAVIPYLKSWYMGVKYDPRAAGFDGMSSAAEVESFDLNDAGQPAPSAAPQGKIETVATPSGREFEVRHKVVEADSLIASNDASGKVNPDYPQELQPRDRSRAASQAQINDIASNLNPRLLGESASATDGAPIVSPGNVVESGNGRTLAIRQAYTRGFDSADRYRAWLADQGHDVEGMRQPILVRERVTDMTQEELREYTMEANERTTLELSPSERAAADAEKLGDIVGLYGGGDLGSAANRDFVRSFMRDVVSAADRGRFMDSHGMLSPDGRRRMEAALVSRAYGDESLVIDLFESADSDIKAIGGALLDVAGSWAQMRQEARDGVISSGVDLTPNLLEAVNLIRRARAEGRPVAEVAGQNDIFSGEIDPATLDFLSVFYRGESLNRARGRDKVAAALRFYVDQARESKPGENMFGDPEVTGQDVLRATNERLQREEQQATQQSDIFASPRAADQDAGESGRGGQRSQPPAEDEATQTAGAESESLTDVFYRHLQAGTLPSDNNGLRRLVAEFDGTEVDNARLKQAQEDLEAAMARYARDVVAEGGTNRQVFDRLLSLYENQPNLNIRTSTSVENQAYSTPAPLAYVAAQLTGIDRNTRVYEPTAGNGMLLLTADPAKATANEIEDQRFANLQAQGFDAIQGDALDAIESGAVVPKSQDAVITNPPFGSLKDESGKATKVQVDGFRIGKIDHLIAAEALKAMKDDGRATLIIGADKKPGGVSTDDRIFFNWLYGNYNVVGHFEVDGKLYNRQGAGWPVRVITIDGRQASDRVSPAPGAINRVNDWESVYESFEQVLGSEDGRPQPDAATGGARARRPADDAGSAPVSDAGQAGAAGGRGRAGRRSGRSGDVDGAGSRPVGDRRERAGEELAQRDPQQRPDDRTNAQDQLEPGDTRDAGAPSRDQRGAARADADQPAGNALADADNAFQVRYVPRSGRKDEGVLVPVNMAQPLQDALSSLEDVVGDIDQFVADELGYPDTGALHDALMGLQVDSVASAINQIKNRQKGVVVADQTGIGKGRQAAAMIRWAERNNYIPIFVTVKPQLFTDMYGDLADIGTDDISPFLLNQKEWIAGANGEKLFTNKPSAHKKTLQEIAETGALPDGRNALFMTYSQINTANVQRQAISALADRAVFVLDESHNAGGASGTGEFVRSVLENAPGVVYLSATYAKRPDNMPVYFKTDIGSAISDGGELMQAMADGGLPLQTVVANNLVKAGQMFRRERSYDGVSIETVVDADNRAQHEALSDSTTAALRAIVDADKLFHNGFVERLKKEAEERGQAIQDIAGNQASETVNHTEFSSVVHNFVRQMLLGLKADTAAESAIASLKRGEKPLIALENTMGSFLAEYADNSGLKVGDALGDFDYRNVLSRALERTRYVVRVLPNGEKQKEFIPVNKLDSVTRAAYEQAQATIDGLDLSIPVSPLDWIRHRLEDAGYTVAEITGRNLAVDYSGSRPVLSQVPLTEQNDKVSTTRMFNDGRLDAIILNVSGSTGISLHASEKFLDQRKRHMIVAQPAQDINIFMQMLGRVHRTGQVQVPSYEILNADLPAEKRPTALLNKKMKSLNANTSSNTESATSIKSADMLNKYGDQVIGQYLSDDPDLAAQLGLEGDLVDSEGRGREDIARKATGRMALMPVQVQKDFYTEVEAQYEALMDYLNETNQNDLEPRTFDYEAVLEKESVIVEASDPASPFGDEAVYGEYRIKAQGKQMTPDEVRAETEKHLDGRSPEAHAQGIVESLKAELAKQPAKEGDALADQNVQVSTGERFITDHPIGSAWRIEINGDIYNGVVTNLRNTHKKSGNPFSLSKTQVTLAVNGPLRSVTIPASQWERIEVGPIGRTSIETMFSEQVEGSQVAKIVTGNLLAAYGEIRGAKGTIISFTKKDGSIEQGILLPKKFDVKANTRGDYQFRSSADVMKFMSSSSDPNLERFGIATRDGVVRLRPRGRRLSLVVPKSKSRGGKWFLDKGLTALTGDFVSSGQNMVATFPQSEAGQVIDYVMNRAPLYAPPSMVEEVRQVLGLPDRAGEARYSVVREPLTRNQVHQFAKDLEKELGLETLFLSYRPDRNTLSLDNMVVPSDSRKGGLGSQAMERIADLADRHGARVVLTPGLPDDRHGTTSRARLVRFYKRFGFIENKGRNKDFTVSEGMYREPQDSYSVAGEGSNLTASDLHREIRRGPMAGAIDKLVHDGRVVLHDTARAVAPNAPAGAQAATAQDGSIHLFGDGLSRESVTPVLLHEVFHGSVEPFIGSEQWVDLNKRLGALYRQAQRSEGKMNRFWRDALERIENAERMGDRMTDARRIEEFGAYAIENYEAAPPSIRKWVDQIIGALKNWLQQRFGIQAGQVTPAQLRALAVAALRDAATRPSPYSSRPLGGMALNSGALSVSDVTQTPAFKRWFGDSKVVDENGEPLVVYHGTNQDITAFDSRLRVGDGIYFSSDPDYASGYGEVRAEVSDSGAPTLYPAYLSVQNPLTLDGENTADWSRYTQRGFDSRELTAEGYDGVVVKYADGELEVMVFSPEQIKSSTGNRGTFDSSSPDIRYSVKPSKHFKDLNEDQKSFLDKIGPERLPQRLRDRMDQLTDNLALRVRQAGVDRYAALLRNDQALYGEDTLEGSIASSSWVLARMSHSAGGAVSAMLDAGRIYLDDKEKVIDIREDTRGLAETLRELGTPQEIDRFMGWIAANRARRLMEEGRENLFTENEIDAGIKLSSGKLEDGRNRGAIYTKAWREFQQYRDDVLGIAEQSGIITTEQRETWSEEFYVPFYRVLDDESIGGPRTGSGLSRQQAFKKLKGGKQNLNDLLENTLLNFHHLLQASLKNQAAVQAVQNARELGIAVPTTEAARDRKLGTFVMEGGEKKWYNIDDPLTFKAISALSDAGLNTPAMKIGRAFKRLLTNMITITPQFVVANLLRDTLSAMATSPTSGVPFKNAITGAITYGNSHNRARMLASGAAFSFGHVYGQNATDIKASLRGTMREARVLTNPALIPGVLNNAWRKYNSATNFAENVNRAGIWERNLKEGKLKAAFEARDLMDFSAHGDAPLVRVMIDLVPFLNARIQGADKLYRSGFKPGAKSLTGKGAKADRRSFARFATVTSALAVVSMALYLRNHDDEEYRKLEDWQRDTYWFIRFGDNAFFIPKPFEVGSIATMAERLLEQFVDPTVGGEKLADRFGHVLMDTFSLNPIPQALKPAYELAINEEQFTGRPIESAGMERLSPSLRSRPSTSSLAEGLSRGMEATLGLAGAGDAALSPVQIDHLIRGYLGQVGASAVATSDVIWRRMMGEELPARRWSEYQPIRRFYKDLTQEDSYTRYGTDFYNALKEVDRIHANIRHLQQHQELERADRMIDDNLEKLSMRQSLNKIQRDLSKINSDMKRIQRDHSLSGEEKRMELDRLRSIRNTITEMVGKDLEQQRVSREKGSGQ